MFLLCVLWILAILGSEIQNEVRDEMEEFQDELRGVVGEEEEETITTTSPKTTNKTMDIDASKLFFRGVKGYNPIGTGPSKAQLLSPSRKFPSGNLPNLQSKSSTQNGHEKADAKKGSSLPVNIGGTSRSTDDSDEDEATTTEEASTTEEFSNTTREIAVWMEREVGTREFPEIRLTNAKQLTSKRRSKEYKDYFGKFLTMFLQTSVFYVCVSFTSLFASICLFHNYYKRSFHEKLLQESFYEEV